MRRRVLLLFVRESFQSTARKVANESSKESELPCSQQLFASLWRIDSVCLVFIRAHGKLIALTRGFSAVYMILIFHNSHLHPHEKS